MSNGIPDLAEIAAKAAGSAPVAGVEMVEVTIGGETKRMTMQAATVVGIQSMNGFLKSIDESLREIRDALEESRRPKIGPAH